MQGPEGAAKRAAEWLEGRISARLRIIEDRLDLEPLSLPDPAQVLAHERGPIGIEDWPSVFVLPLRMVNMRLIDVEEDSSETYRTTYAIQILGWVRADDYDTTSDLRFRYALAIREALLERKSLRLATGVHVGDPNSDLAIDPASIVESYSPVMTDDAARTIAGVDLTVNVIVREVLAPPPSLGTATGVDVVVERVALDDPLTVTIDHPAL